MSKNRKIEFAEEIDTSNYDNRQDLQGVIKRESYDFVTNVNKFTIEIFKEEWIDNVRRNKKLWKRHRKLKDSIGIGKNKCVIGVGAGPSFHKNKDVLKRVVNEDGRRSWEDRDFITIAANHQYKPLLEMGIIPDFVLLVDASGKDSVYDQLCRDIPPEGQNTILITGVHTSPRTCKAWSRQGREILFYTTESPELQDEFKKYIKGQEAQGINLGGNVLNGAWMIGLSTFFSTVFMGVGNDLSFERKDTLEEQRKAYYHDGDYSSNIGTTGSGRDEASSNFAWAGFKLSKRNIWLPDESIGSIKRYNVDLEIVGTSKTLWVYKTWLEGAIMSQTGAPVLFNYFNCSEGGILGVMAKDDSDNGLFEKDNWFLLDSVAINQHTGRPMYHTATLKDATDLFKRVKRSQKWETPQDVQYATGSEAGV